MSLRWISARREIYSAAQGVGRCAMSKSFNLCGDGRIGGLQFQHQQQQHLQRLLYRMNADGLQRGSPISAFSALPPAAGVGRQAFYGTNFSLYEDNSLCTEDEEGGGMRHADKKRRLSVEQVKSLEMSFEMESKLEPERKMQLAAELGLQPRQVAVWFQNRRARWKTKQLERDYEHLKQQFNAVFSEKEKLRAEVARLTQELQEADRKRGPENEEKQDNEEGDHEPDHDQPTITSSHGYCSQEAATLITPRNSTEDELEAEACETEPARKNKGEEEFEQSMSPASFCSDADSNRRHELFLPSPSCTDIGIIQAMKNEETKDKLRNMNLLYSHDQLPCDLYFDECPITAEERQWLSYYSHAKP